MKTNLQIFMKKNNGAMGELSNHMKKHYMTIYNVVKKNPEGLKRKTKKLYYNGLVEAKLIKKEDFTYLSLFEYENNKKDTVLPVS